MARQRHLKNAPLVEAIIDFRVRLAPFDVTRFASLKETLRIDYPKVQEPREFVAGIGFAGKQVQQILEDKGLRGYFLRSVDDRNVVQLGRIECHSACISAPPMRCHRQATAARARGMRSAAQHPDCQLHYVATRHAAHRASVSKQTACTAL